jgi:hypothetical protein
MQTLLTDNITYLHNRNKNLVSLDYDVKSMNEQSLKMLSDYFQTSIDYLLFEDLTVMSKRERLDNYLLIQKRLAQ